MTAKEIEKPGLIQHKVRPEVKRWIEDLAKSQERSQGWITNKLLEEAYACAQQKESQSAKT